MINSVLRTFAEGFIATDHTLNDVTAFFKLHNDLDTLHHTLQVAGEATRLAELYGVDPVAAEQAALLHDISNVIPIPNMLEVAEELSISILDEERKYSRIVHQKLSTAMAREIFGIADERILSAIECHTTFKPNASLLDRILFVADKISWNLPGEHPYLQVMRTKADGLELDAAILIYLNQVWDQRDRLKLVHPWLISAREQLLGEAELRIRAER
jgi:predicted HD superfamily hydrolase involved in NAD metabolism